ncbi:RNA-binding protein EWS [Schistosoma japonicum]|nr:RNA-binding protein EWS [Schistosoma japonicum]
MADQFAYANMQQASQTGYPPFHYPTASDQNAQLLQGYALSQPGNPAAGVPGSMFGAQSAAYSFDQTGSAYNQSSSIPVCQVDGSQVPMQPATGGFAYPNFSGSFNQYPGMGQGMPPGLSAVQAGFSADMQQFGPLMANAFGQTMSANGAILEAIAHEQGLAGFNPVAFLQDPTGTNARGGLGSGRGSRLVFFSQRGGYNKFGGTRSNSNLPSVTNPDGLREDTIFVSNLPQNIDHDVMKSQFGVVGKIKINSKSGMPMIWIFKEKGIPKGEALVTYEDPSCVQSAIQWFKEHEFLGRKIEVKQAINSQRPVIIPPGGGGLLGGNGSGPNNPAAALAVAAVAAAASGNTVASLMNNSAAAAASLAALTANNPQLAAHFDSKEYSSVGRGASTASRGSRGAITNGSSARPNVGSAQAGSREGDWSCPQCGNINFSWREQCNRCQSTRLGDGPNNTDTNARNNVSTASRAAQPPAATMNSGSQQNAPGFGRGGAINPVSSSNRGGRGGGPMRGSSVGTGRARPAPY